MRRIVKRWRMEDVVYWAAALAPFLISAVFYSRLPEQVPTHWNFNNMVNGYSSRNMAAWGIPGFMFLMAIVVNISLAIDPRKGNIEKSRQMRALGRWWIVIFAIFIQIVIMVSGMGVAMNVGLWTKLAIGVMIVAIGNYLPKCRQNYTLGIKIPWALDDEENWRMTHRMAGRLWILGGLVMMLCAFFDSYISAVLFFVVIITISIIPYGYSYLLFQRKHGKKQD